jgi:hypothetical protein
MGKINQLSAEGVTDLHSYGVGYKDGRRAMGDEVIAMVKKVLGNAELDIDMMSSKMSLTVLVATILAMQEDEEDSDVEL